MNAPDRKPTAPMESRDERITVRFTPSQRAALTFAARQAGEELSRYIRVCALMGHTMRQTRIVGEMTGA